MRYLSATILYWTLCLAPLYADTPAPVPPPPTPAPAPVGLELPAPSIALPSDGFVTIAAKTPATDIRFIVVGSSKAEQCGTKVFIAIPPTPGTVITVFAYASLNGTLTDPVKTTITVEGDVPTPAPTPNPQPSPSPTPTPTPTPPVTPLKHMHATIIEDASRRSPEIASVLTSQKLREFAASNNIALHIYDAADPAVKTKQLDKAVQTLGGVPCLVLQSDDGKLLPDGKPLQLPAADTDLINLLKKTMGK